MNPPQDALVDLGRLTLVRAAAGIREGTFSAEALAMRYLQRIREHDKRIHAWAWLDPERVLKFARLADAELRAGYLRGPLHGIPLGVKDIFETAGIPTRMGSPIFSDFVPQLSASCVLRLEQSGAYVQGKTVTTEFATQQPGPTANPWNVGRTPGGSSSGSAAAVAAGFTCGAIGTQTRGSLIRPAAYCGIVGFKPSYGLISRKGVHELSLTLDHVGVLARDIADAGLLVAVMAHEDQSAKPTLGIATLIDRLKQIKPVEQPPRLAAIRSPVWETAEPSQQALFVANCRNLAAVGARVDDIKLPASFGAAGEITRAIQAFEIARKFRQLKFSSGELMSAKFRELCDTGERITEASYKEALLLRGGLCKELADLLGEFDAIVTPPATGEAPESLASTGDPTFSSIWTLCGLPCVSFPSGMGPSSMPMGLQVVGAFLDDARTLEIAAWCSRSLPFLHHIRF
jgi:Asp-tRNA(Asn)/Glu-tRNA(Gln) amidotransferase A subunit family amidase